MCASICVDLLMCRNIKWNFKKNIPTVRVKMLEVLVKEGNRHNYLVMCTNDKMNQGNGSRGE
jgi:hypothetical protein